MQTTDEAVKKFIKYSEKIYNKPKIETEEEQKMILYSLFSQIILSKKIFAHNTDIKNFLKMTEIQFKPYVFSSRTQIISRIIRLIQNSDYEFRQNCFKRISTLINNKESAVPPKSTKTKSKKNSVDDIIGQFGRK